MRDSVALSPVSVKLLPRALVRAQQNKMNNLMKIERERAKQNMHRSIDLTAMRRSTNQHLLERQLRYQ